MFTERWREAKEMARETAAAIAPVNPVRERGAAGRVTLAGCLAGIAVYQPVPVLISLGATALLLLVVVVGPAIWSRKPLRRAAALDVLDRLLGRPTPATASRRSVRGRQR